MATDMQEQNRQQTDQVPQGQAKAKPLRFVTTYGAPHPKRRRIGAACLTCRKRKTACSGERPTCETCKQNRLDCAGYASESSSNGNRQSDSETSPRQPVYKNGGAHWPGGNDDAELDPELSSASYVRHDFQQPRAAIPGALPPLVWGGEKSYDNTSPRGLADPSAHVQASPEVPVDAQTQPEPLFSGPRNRMPYFRWLGPTAIMPGFKQMVVKVKRQDADVARSSTDGGAAAAAGTPGMMSNFHAPSLGAERSVDNETRTPLNLPFYDTSPMPPSELITHLANTFFTHLGCNYPFLQRERFLRDLEEKQVDAILVDAVCAIAARFSTHPLLTQQASDESKTTPAEYGHAFAQRAQVALVDTFSYPTVAAVQAALLLAYIEFGESRDSGLWMYLGISIRMAQDLGLHKVEGLKYRGRTGPTPKLIKRESMSGSPEIPAKLEATEKAKKKTDEATRKDAMPGAHSLRESVENAIDTQDQTDEVKAVEQERVDTFWAVFFLDKMVSSGTGRRGTLRDKDIELSFPPLDATDPKSGWPIVFPALIRIVHLYGRVADLLNSLKEPSDITTDTPKRLASMESHVTNFYSGLSPKLHFDAVNFQHYVKAGEGTNFVLLHFWFHVLIVILHQPTLLMTFEGRMLQLFPNSRQLSMSSAKTIADILSYSQLMDAKASLGNPFTTQPIYIAACAFLKETAEQTASSTAQSRASSPVRKEKASVTEHSSSINSTPNSRKRLSIHDLTTPVDAPTSEPELRRSSTVTDQQKSSDKSSEGSALSAMKTANAVAKHTLLATAATQHYQLCYKALESLETYWAGTKYILTVLDQKFQGVGDPLLYTVEEGNSAMEVPRPEPAFTSPGWRRKLSWGPYLYNPNVVGSQDLWNEKTMQIPGSPAGGDVAKAIGWTMTGTMNSPSTSLAWHYPSAATGGMETRNGTAQAHMDANAAVDFTQHSRTASNNMQPQRPDLMAYANSDGSAAPAAPNPNLMLPHNHSNSNGSLAVPSPADFNNNLLHPSSTQTDLSGAWGAKPCIANWPFASNLWSTNSNATHATTTDPMQPFGDMMIESQDVDMSMLGLEMMPWFESWPTHEGLGGLFDQGSNGGHGAPGNGGGPPSGV